MMPEELVLAIEPEPRIIRARLLHVSGTRKDELVNLFELPFSRNQLARQPIQQLRMRRWFAAGSEVAGRGHDAAAHVMLPEAIDDHARQQPAGALVHVGKPFS